MNRGLWLAISLSLGVAGVASGCYMGPTTPPPAYVESAPAPVAADDGTVYPAEPPPDPIPEYQPPAPAYGYSWVGGYWDWTGFEWSWNAGYWAPADQAYLFIGPRFVFLDGRPVFYRPYWQGPGGRRAYGYGYRGTAPAGAWRARPSVAPGAWRAGGAHNEGWRRTPGAAAWHGGPAGGQARMGGQPMRTGNPGYRPAPPAARAAGAPAFHSAPAPAFHSAPAPAFHPAPSGGGGGGRRHK
jgi:hypothetical protein